MMWQKYREHTPELAIGLLSTLLLVVALVSPPNPISSVLEQAEMALYDLRLRLGEGFVPAPPKNPPIIIINVDEDSQLQEGRWPWSRDRIANLIRRIGEKEPALIVIDTLLSSTEPQSNTTVCDVGTCPIDSSTTPADRLLANTIAQYDVVSGFVFHSGQFITGKLPDSTHKIEEGVLRIPEESSSYATSLPLLQRASKAQGYMNVFIGRDGIVRRYALFREYDDYLYPSLALATVQRYLLEADWQPQIAQLGQKRFYAGLIVGNNAIRTDPTGDILLPFQQGKPPFQIISATDVMRNDTVLEALEGSIVLIGASSVLLGDLKSTPTQADMPGVMLHAYAVWGMLNPEILLHEPAWGLTLQLLLLGGLGIVLLFIYPQCGPRTLLLSGGILTILLIGFNYWAWHEQHIRLDLLPSLVLVLFLTALFVVFDLLRENRHRNQLQHLFGQYVPPEHIQQILAQPQTVSFEGEKREMTVLFADLHDFTSIAEQLDTHTLKQLLNHYLNLATDVIFEYNGTVDKYIGDMVMAFWNAPLREVRHAQYAVLCALGLREMLKNKADEFRQFGITPLQLGIGINTGEMNVGDMGSDHRRAYTVLGDAVNLAARIESLTRFYGVDILVTEHTARQCQGIAFRSIDRVRVKGKRETVLLLQPLGLKSDLSPTLYHFHKLHERAMQHYWQREWAQAAKLFARILIESPDDKHIAEMFLQRIAQLSQQPHPTDWDGVYEHHRK